MEEVEDPDFVGLCVAFLDTGDLRRFPSLSDELNGALYRSEGEADPSLCKFVEVAVSIST